MEHYKIYFEEDEEEDILNILRSSNDVLIDCIQANNIGITIKKEDADSFYFKLLDRIDRTVSAFRPHRYYY